MMVMLEGFERGEFYDDRQPTALAMMRLIRRMRYADLVKLADAIDVSRCDGKLKSERRLTANMVSEAARSFIRSDEINRQSNASATPAQPKP